MKIKLSTFARCTDSSKARSNPLALRVQSQPIKSVIIATSLLGLGIAAVSGQNTYTFTGTNGASWIRQSNWTGGAASKSPGVDANASSTVDGATTDIAAFSTSSTILSVGINFNTSANNGVSTNSGANQLLTLGAITLATGGTSGNFLIGNNSTTLGGVLTLSGVTVGSGSNVILKNSSSNTLSLQNIQGSGNKTMDLALGNATDNKVIIDGSGDVSIGSIITGTSKNLTLGGVGTGKLLLTGASTYSGATLISSGTLALGATGSINNTSSVSLGTVGTFDVSAKSGGYTVGTLKGSGNVTGALTVSTQLAIGNSPGTTNFSSNLTLGSSSTYLYDMTGGVSPGVGSADLGNVTGTLTITTGAILDLVELGTYTVGNKFTLFGYTGGISGTFSGLADDTTFLDDLANTWMINYNDTSAGANDGTGTSFVTITAVPEPASVLIGAIGLIGLLRRRRR